VSDGDQQSTLTGARSSEPRPVAGPDLGQALQDQIAQALQPAMAELREQIAASVRRELEPTPQQEGRGNRPDAEHTSEQRPERRQRSPQPSATRQEDRDDEDEHVDRPHAGTRAPEQRDESVPSESRAIASSDRHSSNEAAEPPAIASPELGQGLQEQISRALQPTMAEFREQMSATVRHELNETLQRERRRPPAEAQRTADRGQGEEHTPSDRGADQPEEWSRSKGSDSAGQRGREAVRSLLGKPLLEALPGVLEQQGEQWLRSRLDLGIDFVFSDAVRAVIQQEAGQMLQLVARAATSLTPDRAAREELRAQADRMVETLVETSFDRFFADEVREDLKARGHEAIRALLQPDLKALLPQTQDLLLSLLAGLLNVLRECWEQILQFLTRVVVTLLQSRLTSVLKGAFTSLVATPGRDGDKHGPDSSTSVEEQGSESRQKMTEPAEDPPGHGARETDEPQQRAERDDRPTGDDQDDQRHGRAPAARPPSGRAPSTRQASGRAYSDRAPSGRPSRAASR